MSFNYEIFTKTPTASAKEGQLMKLIVAILRDEDSERISHALVIAEFRVTQIASTGGFLRRGSTTLMIGVDEEKLEHAIQIIKDNTSSPADGAQRKATLFVLNIVNFIQI
ncbi:MAG: cyclic-di-AMP receptor [Anaerolineales bacterium]